MPSFKWTMSLSEMEKAYAKSKKAWDKRDMLREVDRRFYYEGFNVGREKQMFQEELQDLEVVYKKALSNYQREVENVLPALLHYMEEFITLHKQNEAIREKLDALLAKQGREDDQPEGDEDE